MGGTPDTQPSPRAGRAEGQIRSAEHPGNAWLAVAVLAAATLLLYGHTLHVPWYMDDSAAITRNPVVRDLAAAWGGVWQPRGLVTLSFALNYRFGGLDPVGYHLVNIALHFGCGCLAWLLLRRIFRTDPVWPLCGALLFVAHPLQTQAVTYTVQRMAVLSAGFFLLALYLFVRAWEARPDRRGRGWYAGALLCGALAVLCKENAALLPLALLLFVRCFVAPQGPWRPLLRAVAPFAVAPLLVGLYQLLPALSGAARLGQLANAANLASLQGNGPLNYLVTEFSVLWVYLRLLVLPYGQALDHDYPIARELFAWQHGLALLGLLGLVWLAWRLRQRRPVVTFAIGWYFLTLAVESSVIPLDPLFEHRLYLPLFGFAAVVCAGLASLPWPRLARLGAGLLLVALALLTWRRNELWNDPIAFYRDNLRLAPRSERVHNGLGASYYAAGRLAEAEQAFRATYALNPRYFFNYETLPALYQQLGRYDEAIAILEQGLANFPNEAVIANNLACLYDTLAARAPSPYLDAQAERYFTAAIASDAGFAPAYGNLGRRYKRLGRLAEAEPLLRKALAINPLDEMFRADLAELLQRTGRFAEAAALRRQ